MKIAIAVLKTDGTAEEKEIEGGARLLENLQKEVGGFIEPVRYIEGLPPGKLVLVNEDGIALKLPPNPFITGPTPLLGNIILMEDADLT